MLTATLAVIAIMTAISAARLMAVLLMARRAPDRRQEIVRPPAAPLSVLVPCFNEERVLRKTLDSVFASEGVVIARVICIDDGSQDGTYGVMVAAQNHYGSRLQIVRQANGGKAAALNAGLSSVRTKYFVAIDADTQTTPATIAALISNFDDRQDVVAVSGHMLVGNKHPVSRSVNSAQIREYERANNLDRRAFSTANLIAVVPGAVGAFDTQAVKNVGGYPCGTVAEDAHLTFELLLDGGSIVHDPRAVVVTEAPETFAGLLTQRVRWATGKLQVIRLTGRRALRSSRAVRLLWLDTAVQEGLAPVLSGLLVVVVPVVLIVASIRFAQYQAVGLQPLLTVVCLALATGHLILWWRANRYAHGADIPLREALRLSPAKWSVLSATTVPLARFVAGWRAWYTLALGRTPRWNKLPRSGDVVLDIALSSRTDGERGARPGATAPVRPVDAAYPARSGTQGAVTVPSSRQDGSGVANEVVRVESVVVNYGEVSALKGISFSVQAGDTLGLLGGNGAGKTTTISTMLGLIVPASGRVEVLGAHMTDERYAVLHRINLSSPYVALPALLTVRQILRFYGRLYNVRKVDERVKTLAEDLDLSSLQRRPFGELSAGQKTRVSLAKALINQPEVLFLDEPTASLDPETAEWVRALLERYQRDTGATIVIASHNMAEVERLCTDVVILGHGRVIERGTPGQLLRRYDEEDLGAVFMETARTQQPAEEVEDVDPDERTAV